MAAGAAEMAWTPNTPLFVRRRASYASAGKGHLRAGRDLLPSALFFAPPLALVFATSQPSGLQTTEAGPLPHPFTRMSIFAAHFHLRVDVAIALLLPVV